MITCSKICKSFGEKEVLKDLNFKLEDNSITCILGVNGCGKTTFLNILAGLTFPDSGIIRLNNKDITGTPGYVSYMTSKDLLLENLTVLENASLPLILKGISKREALKKAYDFLSECGIYDVNYKLPKVLSSGMRQRVAFARTLLNNKEVILLDEPFSALDSVTKFDVIKWFKNIISLKKLSILLITHDINEALSLSKNVFVMSKKNKNLFKLENHFDADSILNFMN